MRRSLVLSNPVTYYIVWLGNLTNGLARALKLWPAEIHMNITTSYFISLILCIDLLCTYQCNLRLPLIRAEVGEGRDLHH